MKENIFDLEIDKYPIGKKVTEYVNFPSFYGLQEVQAPVTVYRASKEIAPCLVITACVHGDEINGLHIAQTLIRKKLKLLKGTLIILPVVNIYGLLNKQRYLPDRKDLNRCFPGSENGSFGSRFARFILNNISKYGDVFIDLHSGTVGRFNTPQIRADLSNTATAELVKKLSIPFVVNSSLRDGSLREALDREEQKPALVFEGGEGHRVDAKVTRYGLEFIYSVMSVLGMMTSKKEASPPSYFINKTKWIRAKEGGILLNKIQHNKAIRKGQLIGELRQITGELISKIYMEQDGIILGVTKTALIMSGDALYNIGILGANTEEYSFDDEVFDFES